jgi:hypothetical protein
MGNVWEEVSWTEWFVDVLESSRLIGTLFGAWSSMADISLPSLDLPSAVQSYHSQLC